MARFAAAPVALAAAVPAAILALLPFAGALSPARAEVPTGTPAFSDPLDVDNDYFPVLPGAMKVLAGRNEGARTTVVEYILDGTRSFPFGEGSVECRIQLEVEFEEGVLKEVTRNFFAQSDDGSVWFFGELVDNYEDGVLADHEGSFLVGGPSEGDPEETVAVATPSLFMPGVPEVGDEYTPEDLPDETEVDTVVRTGRTVRVPAGTFTDCIEVRTHEVQDGEYETKWFAPGIGKISKRTKEERVKLDSATPPR